MKQSRAELQLILLSAGTAQRRDRLAGRAWRLAEDVDWDLLGERLRVRRLLATLGPRLLELAGARVGPGFAENVENAAEAGRRQGRFLQLVNQHVVSSLVGAGIRCTPLKGPELGEAVYGDVGRRLSGDLDILVLSDQLNDAVEVVCGLGYERPTDYVLRSGLPLLHFALEHKRGDLPPVELHWRVHWYEERYAADRLLAPSHADPATWRPAAVDELASLLLFYARDGFIDLRLASDIAALWDERGASLSDGALDEPRDAYPSLSRALLVAAHVAEGTVGLPADRICLRSRHLTWRDRLAVRLANPNPNASQSQLYADMGLIDGLLTPRNGLRGYVRRQLLPPPEVLRAQARHAAKERVRSAAGHGTGALARYSLTLARSARTPEVIR